MFRRIVDSFAAAKPPPVASRTAVDLGDGAFSEDEEVDWEDEDDYDDEDDYEDD